jgi:hypothetical protein
MTGTRDDGDERGAEERDENRFHLTPLFSCELSALEVGLCTLNVGSVGAYTLA